MSYETANLIAHSKKELILMFQSAIHAGYQTEIILNNPTKTKYTIKPEPDEKTMKETISRIRGTKETEFEFLDNRKLSKRRIKKTKAYFPKNIYDWI